MDRCTALVGHETPEYHPIQLAVGEVVEVGERDTEWPEFVKVNTKSGSGWVPARHLSAEKGQARVIIPYDTTELATVQGEELVVLKRDRISGWTWCQNSEGREGWVPDRTLDLP
ncbi:MAG: hypothetical protein DWQ40_11875 [Actinobacteria bacterium]|nr:MAG: hypothetical protein DWQ40_11875 [Actinomycetota bacterium]REK35758.1 MAG: hypothetical protein DWQ20_05905 [Actinomycetota bacterium]